MIYALMLGIGVGSLGLRSVFREKAKSAVTRRGHWGFLGSSVLANAVAAGSVLYLILTLVSNHKTFLKTLVLGEPGPSASIGAGAVAPLVGMLGVLMALVTAGVINLARKAVDDLNDARKDLKEQIEKHEDTIKKHRSQMLSEYSTLELMQQRLLLLHINDLEIQALSANDLEPSKPWAFRSQLGTLYARPSPFPLMEYLDHAYDPPNSGGLLDAEKAYIRTITAHWREYGEGKHDKEGLVALAERVLNKL